MGYADNNSGSEQPAERRVWEAPKIVTIVPVDRTAGGLTSDVVELGVYKAS